MVPFSSWHLAACFGLGFTTVVVAAAPGVASRTEGDSSHFSSVALRQSCEAGDTRRIKDLKAEKDDIYITFTLFACALQQCFSY